MTLAQLLPPFAIATAFAASLAMPVLLAVFARGPFARLALGTRFWLAMVTAAGAWLLAVALHSAGRASDAPALALDAGAGAAILLTAGLVVYSVWSLACFGFSSSMLLSLAAQARPLSVVAWAAAYADGRGLDSFTRDRVSVLLGMGLAIEEGERLALSGPFALRFARFVDAVSRLFGVRMDA